MPSKFVENDSNRPSISAEARFRIKNFVRKVDRLQKEYGIEIRVQDDSLILIDQKRTDKWNGYGEWDACFFQAEAGCPGRIEVEKIHFEDFAAWGK